LCEMQVNTKWQPERPGSQAQVTKQFMAKDETQFPGFELKTSGTDYHPPLRRDRPAPL